MRTLLIINEVSGDKEPNSEKLPRIRKILEPAGFELQVETPAEGDDVGAIVRKAVESGVKAVLVGGGDGTVSVVAAQLVGREIPLGVIPLGTFNNIARSLGMPEVLEEACTVIARSEPENIDVGQVKDGAYFFEAAGCGLDAALFPVGEEIKGGQWTRWLQFGRLTMRYSARRVHLEFDRTVAEALPASRHRRFARRTLAGRTIALRALIVVVGNGPYYGGGFGVSPGAKLTDGLFTISAYRRFSKLELFRHFWSISRGQRKYSPKIETFSAAKVTIRASRPVAVHADGVPFGEAPQTFLTLPGALRVFAAGELQ